MASDLLPPFEELDHTADLALCARGITLAELFIHAAQGMFALMRCQPDEKARAVAHHVALESLDAEALLVDWLNELLYLAEREQGCYDTFTLARLEPTRLEATLHGQSHCPPQKGIKAATFSNLQITPLPGRYEVSITFDV